MDVALCEECNPLGLKQPAATQVHAIAAGGIILFVLILAVMGRVATGGIGPFAGQVAGVEAAPGGTGLAVTIEIENAGRTNSATTCRIVTPDRPIGGAGQVVQTPNVPAGESVTFTAIVTAFGDEPVDLAVDCASR